MLKEFRKLLKSHRKDKNLVKFEEINCKKGTNNILLSAPHTFTHEKNGENKSKDYLTYSLIRVISELSNCHVMYINKEIDYDPNYDKENNFYYEYLKKYVRSNNIDYVIDIHSLAINEITDLDIGVDEFKNVNNDKKLVKDIVKELNKYSLGTVTIDKIYRSHNRTICSRIHKDTGVKSIQLEIGQKNRNFHKNKAQVSNLINAILGVINYLENKSKFSSVIFKDKKGKKVIVRNTRKNKFDYEAKFDKVLDIKPAFGYERKLKEKIAYDEVGLEIEVSVTLERDKYSFTKKLLANIKELVGENGYFVKDGTIIGDYSFEIVLDPLKVEEIYEFWNNLQEIMIFSKGIIQVSSEKNCGIHMNFNQYDVTNPIESHKKLMALLSEKENYFEENIYKQYKFIWDFEEYCKYQRTISSKYLWINYLDKKLVEVRNVKTSLNSIELVELIKKILNALYYDRNQIEFDYKSFVTLNKIYDTAIDKIKSDKVFDELNRNGFVIIGFNNKTADIIVPSDKIVQEIKNDMEE